VLAILLCGAACQATTTVAVAVRPDGSGTVEVTTVLDAAAAAQVPDLDQSLLVKDLRTAGWKVVGPLRVPGGGWQVSASKPFADPAALPSVIDQVTGPGGPFRDFALTRSHSFAKTSFHLSGTIDLSGGLDAFGDAKLRAALGGTMYGRSDADLARELGGSPAQAIHFRLVTKLPGGGTKQFTPQLGDGPLAVSVTGTKRSDDAWLFASAAFLAFAGFGLTLFLIVRFNRIHRAPSYVHRPGGPRRPWEV
jgi:hypothetical protein